MKTTGLAHKRLGALISEAVCDNPVLIRELRARMRGRKAFLIMGGYVLLLGFVLFMTFVHVTQPYNRYSGAGYGATAAFASADTGRRLFSATNWTQTVLLALVIPAITFLSITGEIEKKTIEMLALTRLSAGRIVIGKQLASFVFCLMLMACSAPLAALCLVFGGISPAEILVTYVVVAAWAFLFSAVGVFWSSMFNRAANAELLAYATCGLYLLVLAPFGKSVANPWVSPERVFSLSILNPGWAPVGALATAKVCGISVPIAAAAVVVNLLIASILLLTASTHVRYCRVERGLAIRVLILLTSIVLVWLVVGNLQTFVTPTDASSQRSAVATAAGIIAALLSAAVAVFATGTPRVPEGKLMAEYALSARRAFRSDLGGSLCFMALWTVVALGATGGVFVWMLHANSIVFPRALLVDYLRLSVSVLAVVVGVSAFGVLASTLVKLRRSAAALVILFVLIAFIGYPVALMYYVPRVSNSSDLIWQTAAFWPLLPVVEMSGLPTKMPSFWWLPRDSWTVVSCAYVSLAMASLAAASAAFPRFGGVKEE